jgi:hypothetical protein
MVNFLYGMNCELINNQAPCLVFSKNSVWAEVDLVEMEKKMLLNYPIPRLLPLRLNEMDLQITLSYSLGKKRTLSHLRQQQTLNEAECFQILFAIVTTILESKSHLLNEERYLVQESFIYIGIDYLDVNLIYLPIYVLADKPPLQTDLLKLTHDLLTSPGIITSANAKQMILLLNSASFQLNSFKELLFQAITELASLPEAADFHHTPAEEPWFPVPNQKKQLIKWRSHNPTLVTITILIIILIATLYITFPSIGMFNLSLGLSFLVINISFRLNQSIGKMDTGELPGSHTFGIPKQLSAPILPDKEYYSQLADQTTLLMPAIENSDATVLLPPPLKAFLELTQGDETELIKITNDTFIIGRSTEAAQFAINWVGLSRTHLEINRLGNEFVVKDLGSKNGSFLNDEAMVPHQSYPLKEGDCIRIVEKQFIYKRL